MYSKERHYALPATRERTAVKLLNYIDLINRPCIIGAKLDPFYVKLLQVIFVAAVKENRDMKIQFAFDEMINYHPEEIEKDDI